MSTEEALELVRRTGGTINFGVRVIPDARRPKKTRPGVQVHLRSVDVFSAAETLEKAAELARDAAKQKLAKIEREGVLA